MLKKSLALLCCLALALAPLTGLPLPGVFNAKAATEGDVYNMSTDIDDDDCGAQSGISGWANLGTSGGGKGTVVIAPNGKKAISITNRSNNYDGIDIKPNAYASPGVTDSGNYDVTVTGYMFNVGSTGNPQMVLALSDDPYTQYQWTNPSSDGSFTMSVTNKQFQNFADGQKLRIQTNTAGANSTFFITGITVSEYSGAELYDLAEDADFKGDTGKAGPYNTGFYDSLSDALVRNSDAYVSIIKDGDKYPLYVSGGSNNYDTIGIDPSKLTLSPGNDYIIIAKGRAPKGEYMQLYTNTNADLAGVSASSTDGTFTLQATVSYDDLNSYSEVRVQTQHNVPHFIDSFTVTLDDGQAIVPGGDDDDDESSTVYDMQTDTDITSKADGTEIQGSKGLVQNGGSAGQVKMTVKDGAEGSKNLLISNRGADSGVDIKSTLFKNDKDTQFTINVTGKLGANAPDDTWVVLQANVPGAGNEYQWLNNVQHNAGEEFTLALTKSLSDIEEADGGTFNKFSITTNNTADFTITGLTITKPGSGDDDDEPDPPVFPITFDNGFGPLVARSMGNVDIEVVTDATLARQGSSGTKFLKVSNRNDYWNGVQINSAVPDYASSGDIMRFSAWVRLVDPGSAQINLSYFRKKAGSNDEFGHSQFNGAGGITVTNTEWVLLSGTTTLFSNAGDSVGIYIEAPKDATVSFYVDDINFEKVDSWGTPGWDFNLASIKDKYSSYFMVGNITTYNDDITHLLDSYDSDDLFKKHYNVVTAENAMKPNELSKSENTYDFTAADNLVNWARSNGIKVHGHTLVWHNQSPDWLNVGLTRAEAKTNLKNYIDTVAGHYKGKVISWDVVNEAFRNDAEGFNGTDWRTGLRTGDPTLDPAVSYWYEAYANGAGAGESGADFIYDAFVFARKADPDAQLYYNDFNEEIPAKCEAIAMMVEDINAKWRSDPSYDGRMLIEGIGMQSHYWSGAFDVTKTDAAIARFARTGARISISELDMPMGTYQVPYVGVKLTQEEEMKQAVDYAELFLTYKKYARYIDRVTIWGMADDASNWRNGFKATLFDNGLHAKEAYYAVMEPETYASISSGSGSDNSSSSSSSSSGGGGGGSPAVVNTPAPLNQASAVGAVNQAVTAAIKAGATSATVTLKNVSEVTLKSMKAINNAAKGTTVKMNADSMNGTSVDVRITLNPALATKDINLSASTTSREAQTVKATFAKYYTNPVSVVSLSQKGDFGMPVEIAAKVSKELNSQTLLFYAYDKATNSFKQIKDAAYWIDKNGYVHFTTSMAGDIVITDKPLAKK